MHITAFRQVGGDENRAVVEYETDGAMRKVYCLNDRCPARIATGRRRYIGDAGVGGARHQCPSCRTWQATPARSSVPE